MSNDTDRLAHTKWDCKYRIVWAPKYRQRVFYKEKRETVGRMIRELCERKEGVKLIEGEVCPEHIHILVSIPPKYSIGHIMGYLKGKSALQIYDRWPELRIKSRGRGFWSRGYYVDSTGKDPRKIEIYIRKQLEEDAKLPFSKKKKTTHLMRKQY